MPTAGQLMRSRQRFAAALPDRATIERPTETSDGGGGFDTTWADLAEDVPCRLWTVRSGGPGAGDVLSEDATGVVTFAAAQDITVADRIVIDETRYAVLLVRGHGAWQLSCRAEVKELGSA